MLGQGQNTSAIAAAPADLGKPLFYLTGANLAVTTDQIFTRRFTLPSGYLWMPRRIVARLKTGAFSVACLGGVYSAAAKGGDAIVAATQSFGNFATKSIVDATIVAAILGGNVYDDTVTPYLSLTTANSAALTADLFVFADILTVP